MKMKKYGKIPQDKIDELENKLSIKLPQDYKSFLAETGGGVMELNEDEAIPISYIDEKIYVSVLYGVDHEFDTANILFWMDLFRDELVDDAIIIGDSIENGIIVLICSGENKGVYYWDHAYTFEQSNDECNTYWIADSFSDFLKLLSNKSKKE